MAMHINTGSILSPGGYTSKLLNHLELVAGMYDELGIGETIDRLVRQDKTCKHVSIGQAIKAMVLNGLGFAHRALYLTTTFFQDKPVNRLIGAGIEAEHLNDDVLGRALDALYRYGLERLYAQISALALKRLGIISAFAHLDTSSFHTDGQYDQEEETGVIHTAWCHLTTTYGTIQQRWVVVYSPQAYQRALKTLDKDCFNQSHNEFKQFNPLCQQDFACEADALKFLLLSYLRRDSVK
jgi:transposase